MKKPFIYPLLSFLVFSTLAVQAQSLKVGHTRIDYVISQLPEAKAVNNQLTIQQTQAENELKRLQKELQEKYAAYQQGLSQMSDAIRKDKEKELQTLQTRIEEFSRTADTSLQTKYRQLMAPILAKVQQAIDTVAKQNGYNYIINAGSTTNVLYGQSELDVTDTVLKRMGVTPGQTPATPTSTPAPPAKVGTPKKE